MAHLDPNNEDEFRRQIASFFASLTSGKATNQVPRRCVPSNHPVSVESHPSNQNLNSRATLYANQPPAASSPSQIAGPSHLSGHQTPGTTFHPTPASLGQDSPVNSPSWYAGPTSIGSPSQNHGPGSRLPVPGEVGPSRLHPVYPTTRHQPYPQLRPQQQGMSTNNSQARGQAKGKGREIPSTPMDYGLPIPNAPSQGNRLELEVCPSVPRHCVSSNTVWKYAPSTTGPHNRVSVGSPQRPSVNAGYSRSQQTATGTPIHAEWTLASRYPVDGIVPGGFHRPANVQEHMSPINSPRGPGDLVPASYTRPRHPQHQQGHTAVAGSFNPTTYLPTPLVGTNSLPDGSPYRPLQEQPRSLPWRINQKRKPESPSPSATGTLSPLYAVKQLVSHPYSRPANVRILGFLSDLQLMVF